MLLARELPPAEWPRLAPTELGQAIAWLPADGRVVVVETDAGVIVGCWAAVRATHVHGLWMAPGAPAGVSIRLWRAMGALVRSLGAPVAMTSALTPHIARALARRGAIELPGQHFLLPMPGKER